MKKRILILGGGFAGAYTALNVPFSKDIVELPTLRSPTMSQPDISPPGGTQPHESETLEPSGQRQ